MTAGAGRNPTYQQLRTATRQGTYTVPQLIALVVSTLAAIGLGALLVRVGAPVQLALTAGVLLAGSPAMAALAVEGREFGLLSFLRAAVARQRAPRHYAPGPGRRSIAYRVAEPADRSRRTPRPNPTEQPAEPSDRTGQSNVRAPRMRGSAPRSGRVR